MVEHRLERHGVHLRRRVRLPPCPSQQPRCRLLATFICPRLPRRQARQDRSAFLPTRAPLPPPRARLQPPIRHHPLQPRRDITNATLSVIAAHHEALQSLQIGRAPCERITSDAIRHATMCCTRLRRLRLSGIREVDGEVVGALARHCPQLEEIAFLDCGSIHESALGKLVPLRFLSVAGSWNLKWATASLAWSKLLNLIGVDVSRTDVSPGSVSRLLSLSKSMKVLCALNYVALEEEGNPNPMAFSNTKGKVLLALFSDIFKGIASLFKGMVVKDRRFFGQWRSWENKDKNLNGLTGSLMMRSITTAAAGSTAVSRDLSTTSSASTTKPMREHERWERSRAHKSKRRRKEKLKKK